MTTLAWVLGERVESPIKNSRRSRLTSRDLKAERVHAEDVIEQAGRDQLLAVEYGEAVKYTITWLLGERTRRPVD
jgi:hypothetical protein